MTIYATRKEIASTLSPTSPTPQLDADCILQWVLQCDKTQLLLRRNDVLTDTQIAAVQEAVAKRKTGFPIAYITGTKEFYVTPAVLIPKPDTELLVEQTIAAVRQKMTANASDVDSRNHRAISVCDMCAGSGCVGISVVKFLADSADSADRMYNADDTDGADKTDSVLKLTLVDICEDALAVAKKNAERLLALDSTEEKNSNTGKSHLRVSALSARDILFVQSNLFARVPQSFDIIVSNPPYVPHTEARGLLQDGRSEPLLALDGDVTADGDWSGTEDGLALIRRLIPQAYAHLNDDGVLLMETGEYNAEETAKLFFQAGFQNVRIERDLSGQLRNVIGKK